MLCTLISTWNSNCLIPPYPALVYKLFYSIFTLLWYSYSLCHGFTTLNPSMVLKSSQCIPLRNVSSWGCIPFSWNSAPSWSRWPKKPSLVGWLFMLSEAAKKTWHWPLSLWWFRYALIQCCDVYHWICLRGFFIFRLLINHHFGKMNLFFSRWLKQIQGDWNMLKRRSLRSSTAVWRRTCYDGCAGRSVNRSTKRRVKGVGPLINVLVQHKDL